MVFVPGQSDSPARTPQRGAGDHAPGQNRPIASGGGGRLNLLLTAPAWRPDSWTDRLPSLLDPLGICSMRAQTARQAEQMIRQTTVHIAVVDLTLPLDDARDREVEEGGTRILELLARMTAPPPTVVIQAPRGHRDAARSMSAALRCGAFAVVDRSAADIELMLDVMRRMLNRFYASRWPGPCQDPPADSTRPHQRLYDDPRQGPGFV